MHKWITVFMCLVSFVMTDIVMAQRRVETYTVKSLDGINSKVKFMHEIADTILTITYLKDTIRIYDYWGFNEVHVLNEKFIEFVYPVRMGSNEGAEKTILLCVDKRKLRESMYFTSSSNYDYGKQDHGLYNVKMTFSGNNKKDYKLRIHVHDDVYSNRDPKSNYKYNDWTVLNFDPNCDVFYSIKKDIYQGVNVYDIKSGKQYKHQLKGNFPVIILGEYQYYSIRKEWYDVGFDNSLSSYSSYN